ncbi:MAG: HlyC/CorC family transporter [Actinobacteria bacterium]|nr:HlyC/CorC family transporter [Actinomycetota bacterium]
MSWYTLGVLGALLILGNAFFVAVEFSLLAARRGRVEEWAQEGRFGASAALRQMQSLNLQLATCQLGITVMSLLLGWLVEPAISAVFEGWLAHTGLPHATGTVIGIAVALTIVAFVHMVLGEMVPKSLALTSPERSAVLVAPLQGAVTFVVWPVVWALDHLSRWGTRLLRVEPTDELTQAHTPDELALMMQQSVASGELEATEHVLLSGALAFLDRSVGEVMAPASRLVTVPSTATVANAEALLHRSGHSRVLVTGATADDVVGFLHAKDLLQIPDDRRHGLLPPGLVRVALRVRPDDRLSDLLLRMRRARRHVAVVSDEEDEPGGARGGERVVGLVTLEDVLEAIVGDIRDETDRGRAAPDAGSAQEREV